MLEEHLRLGIVRNSSDVYFDQLSLAEITRKLKNLNINDGNKDILKKVSRTRYIKIWHDHSEIAGHGYLLVLYVLH